MPRALLAVLAFLGLLTACQTNFVGDPHIDAATCARKCAQDQLTMAGIVYMGEYSSACVCEARRTPPGSPALSAAGAMGAAAGVMMQMQRQQARQQSGPMVPPPR